MHTDHAHAHGDGMIASDKEAMCPVMKMAVNKKEAEAHGLVRTFNDKKYYLCCSSCLAQLEADPARYIAQKDQA